jgi:transposase
MGISCDLKRAIKMERFSDIYEDYHYKRITCEEAALMLGCSIRQFYRDRQRYDDGGLEALQDKRLGNRNRCAPAVEEQRVVALYQAHYSDCNVSHFHDFLRDEHGFKLSYTWTKNVLQNRGLVGKKKLKGEHRLRRERKPMEGMMLHQDASRHIWFGEDFCDLVVTMDDATSEITSAFFCPEEGTHSSMKGIRETIEKKGLFCSFYTDRGSHYFYTPEANGKVDKTRKTQVGRALEQLKIEHIPAYSPQARGRSERMFGTLQNRLVAELKMNNINDIDAANNYLQNVYLPKHNKKFSVKAENPASAYLTTLGIDINNILCIQEDRTVMNDNTVHYNGKILQLPKSEFRHHFVKAKVKVHEQENGDISIFYGHRKIAEYKNNKQILTTNQRRTNQNCPKFAA